MTKTLDILAALRIPEVQKIFLGVMQDIVDNSVISEMEKAIESQDINALFRATGFTAAALGPIIDAIEGVFQDTTTAVVKDMPKQIITPAGVTTTFRFDMRNPTVEADLKTVSSKLITQLTNEARNNVRNTLQTGMIAGDSPRDTALNIVGRIDPVTKQRVGGVIGLTTNQEGWVRSAQGYLQNLDKQYFNLELRDKRFDSVVKKAIASGEPLSTDIISKIVTAYKANALKWRGENIARTETTQSIQRGNYMANLQLLEEGLITQDQVTKEWDDVGDKKVRHTHRVLASTYGPGKGIGLKEAFVSESGARLMYPGDISLGAGADEVSHCRCTMKIGVDWLAGVD